MNLSDIEQYLSDLAIDVAEGEADPMEVYATIQSIRKMADPLEKSVKEAALEKAKEYNVEKEEVSYKGFKFKFVAGRRMADYKHIGAWVEAEKNKKRIEELAKTAEKYGSAVDPETGEMIDPVRYTFSSEGLSVSKG